jgi:hypothetical protein
MKKLILPIIILVVLSVIGLSLGFFSPYNCFTAKHQLNANHLKKILINDKELWFVVEEKIGNKYGLNVINISYPNERRPVNYIGIKIYNRVMINGFIKSKGENNYYKYKNELDSILSQRIYR